MWAVIFVLGLIFLLFAALLIEELLPHYWRHREEMIKLKKKGNPNE